MEHWHSLKRTMLRAALLIWLLSLFVSIANLAIPLYTLQIFDRVLPSNSVETLFMLLVVVIIFGLLLMGSERIRRQLSNRLSQHIGLNAESSLLQAQATCQSHSDSQTLQLVKNLRSVQQFICSPVLLAAMDATLSPLLIIVLFFLHPYFGYSILLANISMLLILGIQQLRLKKTESAYQRSIETQRSRQQTFVNNIDAMRAMAMADNWLAKHETLSAREYEIQHRYQQESHDFQQITLLVRWSCQIGIPTLGAILLIQQQISAGVMLAALIISMRAILPFETLISSWQLLSKALTVFEQIEQCLLPSPVKLQTNPLTELSGHVVVKSLYTKDKLQQKTLQSVDYFEAEPGSFTAVIGQNGAGKTLFLQTLVKNHPYSSGEVTYDGIDITNVEQLWLGKQIGYVPQKLLLPERSIKDVICHHGESDIERIVWATTQAGVHQTILTQAKGYDTIISTTGNHLSLGILQRIALARALYLRPNILIFDEADAYLDKYGKNAYLAVVKQATRRGRTVIAATQSQEVLAQADRILLLERGKDSFFGNQQQFQTMVTELNKQRKVRSLFGSPNTAEGHS